MSYFRNLTAFFFSLFLLSSNSLSVRGSTFTVVVQGKISSSFSVVVSCVIVPFSFFFFLTVISNLEPWCLHKVGDFISVSDLCVQWVILWWFCFPAACSSSVRTVQCFCSGTKPIMHCHGRAHTPMRETRTDTFFLQRRRLSGSSQPKAGVSSCFPCACSAVRVDPGALHSDLCCF